MKNSIKLGLAALALSATFAACSGNKPAADADTTVVGNTTTIVDTTKNDTTVKTAEPVKKDTVVTTETKKTVIKKK
jgi:ABC-type glycerol-3-phosphate transport system substrate-binding protein